MQPFLVKSWNLNIDFTSKSGITIGSTADTVIFKTFVSFFDMIDIVNWVPVTIPHKFIGFINRIAQVSNFAVCNIFRTINFDPKIKCCIIKTVIILAFLSILAPIARFTRAIGFICTIRQMNSKINIGSQKWDRNTWRILVTIVCIAEASSCNSSRIFRNIQLAAPIWFLNDFVRAPTFGYFVDIFIWIYCKTKILFKFQFKLLDIKQSNLHFQDISHDFSVALHVTSVVLLKHATSVVHDWHFNAVVKPKRLQTKIKNCWFFF